MKVNRNKLLLVIFLILSIAQPVLADPYLSFRDASPIAGHQAFLVYEINGTSTTPLGVFNTSSEMLHLNPNSSYVLQYTAQNSDFIADPWLGITTFTGYVTHTYAEMIATGFALLLFAIVLAIAFKE
jgi:hypothetical protein